MIWHTTAMDEPQCPSELSEDAWQPPPPEVRQFIALLVARLAALEARLNQTSRNLSKPPSSDPLSVPPLPTRTPGGKSTTKAAQPGHPDHQRDLLPMTAVTQVVSIRPACCPACQHALPDDLNPSDGGSRFVRCMLSVSATCQQHKQPLLPSLIAAITASWAHQPAPKLLPSGGA